MLKKGFTIKSTIIQSKIARCKSIIENDSCNLLLVFLSDNIELKENNYLSLNDEF